MIVLILPFPPSVNHYWRNVGSRVLISKDGRDYQREVGFAVAAHPERRALLPLAGRLSLTMAAHPPDRRKRDLDNMGKAVLDALGKAGVYGDDSQIDRLLFVRCPRHKGGGFVQVKIEVLEGIE